MHESEAKTRMPTAFVPHGGGPWPVMKMAGLDDGEGRALRGYMQSIAETPSKPRALLVVSAHWEEPAFTVNTGRQPGLLFDYYGFPDDAYRLAWPAVGDAELAAEVRDAIASAGLPVGEEPARGFDHGTFIPLMLAYPEADIPVVQVSLRQGLDPAQHLELGRALAPLRDRGVYILGSGNSFHNMAALARGQRQFVPASERFDAWLAEAVASPTDERDAKLGAWAKAPDARACHPREEHLIPLMVVAGAAGPDAGRVQWTGKFAGMTVSAHHFG